jgi:hypothetical protein
MNTKVILFLIILIIFLYRFKQHEGFSSAEKDINRSFDMRGVFIKKDKQGRICKISEKSKYVDQNETDTDKIVDAETEVDAETDVDAEKIEGSGAIILEKESEQDTQELLKLNNKLDSMKLSQNEILEESQIKNNKKIVSNLKRLITNNDHKELEKINELTNKINLMHSELKNSKDKEKMFDKLLDKIHTVPPVIQNGSGRSNGFKKTLLFIVLFLLFSFGGFIIYNINTSNKVGDGVSIPLTSNYKDELLRAKKQILSEVI